MGLIKLLLLAVVVFAGLALWRRLQTRKSSRGNATTSSNVAEPMVRCRECQVHIPENKALRSNQHWYCCVEHRDSAKHD